MTLGYHKHENNAISCFYAKNFVERFRLFNHWTSLRQFRLPVGIIPELVAFFFLSIVTFNPAPFGQSSQSPDQPPLCPYPVHIGGDLQPHCLGYLLNGFGLLSAIGKNCQNFLVVYGIPPRSARFNDIPLWHPRNSCE